MYNRLPLIAMILIAVGLAGAGMQGVAWIFAGVAILYSLTDLSSEGTNNPSTYAGLPMVASFKGYAIYSNCNEVHQLFGDAVYLSTGATISLNSGGLKVTGGNDKGLYVLKKGKLVFPA